VLVNPTDDVVVTANWQPSKNVSDYSSYEKHNGAAYYCVESNRLGASGKTTSSTPEFVPNLNYKTLPPLVSARPRELPQYNLRAALPMYFTGMQDLSKLDFLVHPSKYADELAAEKLLVI